MKAVYSKPDFWALKARGEGYPARSVYKLQELAGKFRLFDAAGNTPFRVLDLGAAPGSWSLFILRHFRERRRALSLCACDINPLAAGFDTEESGTGPEDGAFFFLQGDFTLKENMEILAGRGPFDLILSDAAPATSGVRGADSARSAALAEDVFRIAELALKEGGHLTVKVFQGGESGAFLKKLEAAFAAVKVLKPAACRPSSFETYFTGLRKRSRDLGLGTPT